MDCDTFNTRLADWLDESLDERAAQDMRVHGLQCRACSHALATERNLRAELRELPVPRSRPGFAREAIRLARLANGAGQQRRGQKRDVLFALGGAAAASVGVAAVLFLRGQVAIPGELLPATVVAEVVSRGQAFQTVAMTVGHVEAVRLRIDSPRDFDEVRFSVELPDHVWLADQPGIRAMTWAGSLRKGENVLELPLVAQSNVAGFLTARVAWGAFEQRLQAQLIGSPGLSEPMIAPALQEGT